MRLFNSYTTTYTLFQNWPIGIVESRIHLIGMSNLVSEVKGKWSSRFWETERVECNCKGVEIWSRVTTRWKNLSQRMNLATNDFPNLHTDACYSPIYYYLKQLMIPIPCAVIDIFVSMKYVPICLFSCWMPTSPDQLKNTPFAWATKSSISSGTLEN